MSPASVSERNETVRIERPATGGGVGRLADGRVIFVRHSLPGELVRVSISENASKFSRGDAVEVLEPSPDRVPAPCAYAHATGCGGCDLQHASHDAQLSWKQALVREQLRRVAKIEFDFVVEPARNQAQGSRTRLRCAVDERGRLCLRASRSHDLVGISTCWIADEVFNEAFARPWHGAEEVELRAIGEGEPFAVVHRQTHRGSILEVCSLRGEPLEPSTQSRVRVGEQHYSVSPRSFWQSHRDAPEMLLGAVTKSLRAHSDDHVVDLFSGVGLFSVPLARIVGSKGRVTAVESSPYAVRDARQNAEGMAHVRVREWTVSARAINDSVSPGDLVVLDPPRNGLARGVVQALVRRAPQRIAYVSCDAATFARDIKAFLEGGFALTDLKVFDLFPMTEHVELVGSLTRVAEG